MLWMIFPNSVLLHYFDSRQTDILQIPEAKIPMNTDAFKFGKENKITKHSGFSLKITWYICCQICIPLKLFFFLYTNFIFPVLWYARYLKAMWLYISPLWSCKGKKGRGRENPIVWIVDSKLNGSTYTKASPAIQTAICHLYHSFLNSLATWWVREESI